MAVLQRICLILAFLIAATVLAAWLIPGLAAMLPAGWSMMKANTALGMLLAVTSLALSEPRRGSRQLLASLLCAVVIVVVAGAALLEHATGRVSAIDTLLASDPTAADPGLMSLQTAIFLTSLGITLLFVRAGKSAGAYVVDTLAMALVVLALVIFAGYCFGASRLFEQTSFIRTSPQTLVCMVLLTLVTVGRRAEYGYFAVLVGIGIGSRATRVVLPFAMLLPFLLVITGAYAVEAGWLSAPYASALTATATVTLLFALLIAMAWQINDLERELRDMSLRDELTNTYNHRGFHLLGKQAMREARRERAVITVLFFDLDGLKQTNDRYGHEVGSRFLMDVAALLRKTFRGADIVARIGGDEFAVVTHGDRTAADSVVARMREATQTMNREGSRQYTVSYSVGGASSDPYSEETFQDLVVRADTLMYEQKRAKKAKQAANAAA